MLLVLVVLLITWKKLDHEREVDGVHFLTISKDGDACMRIENTRRAENQEAVTH
jgi:hypothetical protein